MSVASEQAVAPAFVQSIAEPGASGATESELWAFAAKHDIELRIKRRKDGSDSLSFGRRDDGGFVLRGTPDRPVEEILAFARTVIERHYRDRKVYAVAEALSAVGDGAPGFADAFLHATAWKLNGAGQFVSLVEAALTAPLDFDALGEAS